MIETLGWYSSGECVTPQLEAEMAQTSFYLFNESGFRATYETTIPFENPVISKEYNLRLQIILDFEDMCEEVVAGFGDARGPINLELLRERGVDVLNWLVAFGKAGRFAGEMTSDRKRLARMLADSPKTLRILAERIEQMGQCLNANIDDPLSLNHAIY